jgi:hypothetical protein
MARKTTATRPGDEAAGGAIVGSQQTESAEEVEGAEEPRDEGGSTGLVGAGWSAPVEAAKAIPSDHADDPVRLYLREISSVNVLSREGEVAKRIEAGRRAVIAGLCESPLTFQAIVIWRGELNEGKIFLRDLIDLEASYAGPGAAAIPTVIANVGTLPGAKAAAPPRHQTVSPPMRLFNIFRQHNIISQETMDALLAPNPDDILWLTPEVANKLGIDYESWPPRPASAAPKVTDPNQADREWQIVVEKYRTDRRHGDTRDFQQWQNIVTYLIAQIRKQSRRRPAAPDRPLFARGSARPRRRTFAEVHDDVKATRT